LRIGPRITLFRKVTLHGEVELDPQRHDPFYVRFTDLYVQWTKSPRFALTVGKQGVPFTVDGATSSRELLTIDRSNLANNIWFPQEYIPGVSVSGRLAPWVYRAGVYSAGFHTTVFPQRSAGTRYQEGTATGKLPAVTIAAVPTGLRKVKSCLSGISEGTVCP